MRKEWVWYYHDNPFCMWMFDEVIKDWNLDRVESFLVPLRGRWLDIGDVWALEAILAARRNQTERLSDVLRECRKFPIQDERLEAEFLAAVGISPEEWENRPEQTNWPVWDWEAMQSALLAAPGALLQPSETPTPHWFGGDEFTMPNCLGCGGPIRQYFLIDLREIEPFTSSLSNWASFPLLGCNCCNLRLHRHDYEVDPETLTVRLVNVSIREDEIKKYGEFIETLPALPKQFARVEPLDPLPDGGESQDWECPYDFTFHSRVGGVPKWEQSPIRVYCRRCREEMIYVASLASGTIGFEPRIHINNDSGYHYHFACNACRTLSVIPQCS